MARKVIKKLQAYLTSLEDDGERTTFAEKCGTTLGHLRNIAYGFKPCGESLAINVERESGGVVRCEDLRKDVDWAFIRGTATESKAVRTGSA